MRLPYLSPAQDLYIPILLQMRINAAWFMSLTLSLSTALIGIMCLQLLRRRATTDAL